MKPGHRTLAIISVAMVASIAVGPFLPAWALFLITVSIAKGLVALGLLLLIRTGLVSFGQGLYFAIGGYAAGMAAQSLGVGDAVVMVLVGTFLSAVVAAALGILLARYRTIFFAMLSLAFSMILYGLLVKSSALGSTDGFNVAPATVAGVKAGHLGRYQVFLLTVGSAALTCILLVHLNLVIAAALAGLGGGLAALTVGHVDPEMAYWTTSGEFVFITILSGTASVLAPFLGALLLELLRSLAYEHAPNTWQLIMGGAMLLVILFLPSGLWSIFERRRRTA